MARFIKGNAKTYFQPASGWGLTLQRQSQNGPFHSAVICMYGAVQPAVHYHRGYHWHPDQCTAWSVCGRKWSINRLSIKLWPMPVSPPKRVERVSHGPWEGKGGGCGGGAGARSLSVSASRAWFDIWYWACGIWMQIYFDCPSVCLVYEESIGDMCACVSERAGSETQKDTENYSDVLYYSPIHLH